MGIWWRPSSRGRRRPRGVRLHGRSVGPRAPLAALTTRTPPLDRAARPSRRRRLGAMPGVAPRNLRTVTAGGARSPLRTAAAYQPSARRRLSLRRPWVFGGALVCPAASPQVRPVCIWWRRPCCVGLRESLVACRSERVPLGRPMRIWWRVVRATPSGFVRKRRSAHGYLVAPLGSPRGLRRLCRRGGLTLDPSACRRMVHLFPSVLATVPVLHDAGQSKQLPSIAAGQVQFLPRSTYDVEGDHPSPPLPPPEGPHPQKPAAVGPFVVPGRAGAYANDAAR